MATPASRPPGRRGPRTKPGEERRRDLLTAGLAVFTRRGVTAATVEEIARVAGVAKGTFYLYFPSKEHLLVALQHDFESSLVDRADAAVAKAGDDWGDRLDAWVRAAFDDYATERTVHDVLFHHPVDLQHPAGDGPAARRDMAASLADLLTAGIAAGAYHVDDPELTAVLLCSALHRAFDRVWHHDGMNDTTRLIASARTLFHRAAGLPPCRSSAVDAE